MKSLNLMGSRMTGAKPADDAASWRLQVWLPLRAQVGENGQHAAVVLSRSGQSELGEDAGDVLLHGPLRHDELLRDARVGAAFRHEAEHLALPRRELVDRVVAPAPAHELGDD